MDSFKPEYLITKMYAGSHAYGTNIATSDVDYRGIFVAPKVCIRTPFFPIYEKEDSSEEDTKFYELSQFMKLALECNPNVIELLWTDKQDIVLSTPAYEHLREHAPSLLSSKIAFTTSGYALAQLKRIKGHYKWISNPQPEEAPRQTKFVSLVHNYTKDKMFKIDLEQYHSGFRLVPYSGDVLGLYEAEGYETFNADSGNLNTTFEGDTHTLGIPLFIVKFNKTEYNVAKDNWSNYWKWKKNRNIVRGKLEENFGYDTKHAMHLVRLLRMGAEALSSGQIIVKRPDAEELLSIRNGDWKYEELVNYAEKMDKYVRETLYNTTKLPKKPDLKLAAKVLMEVQDIMWESNVYEK